jgi:SCY1-like protein 1
MYAFHLQSLPEFAHLLTESLCNDQILPHLATGFADTTPLLREMTVKAILPLAPKITEKSWTSLVCTHPLHTLD